MNAEKIVAQTQVDVSTVYSNDWIELKNLVSPNFGIIGYPYLHEKRCQGKIVSILPFRLNTEKQKMEFLLRREITPCWGLEHNTSSITGGFEEDLEDTVVMEMKEETGFDITKDEIIDLGTIQGTKSTDTVYYLYSVNLTGKVKGLALTDGSELEKNAYCCWKNSVDESVDPLSYVAYHRLMKQLNL